MTIRFFPRGLLAALAATLLVTAGAARAADTIPRNGEAAIGITSDAACTSGDAICSVVALLKGLYYNGSVAARTTGGASAYFVQPTASDNHAVIKNGAGTVYSIIATNNSVTTNYLRLYDLGTGFNGCNSATGLITQVAILPSGGISSSIPVGLAFTTGISICVTSGYATTDTTNATASAMSVTVAYK